MPYDIREVKKNLRAKHKEIRNSMAQEEKESLDLRIFDKLVSLSLFRNAKLILTYVSTNIEVDTKRLISYALKQGKRVAVPRCIDNTRLMKFYEITSLDDLEKHTFGVLEPILDRCEPVENFDSSICILPGLAFDKRGYRLGYGKGYYDRFLAGYYGMCVGLCYHENMEERVPRGRYDRPANYIITEKGLRPIKTKPLL